VGEGLADFGVIETDEPGAVAGGYGILALLEFFL
jgi:hypothetical protein